MLKGQSEAPPGPATCTEDDAKREDKVADVPTILSKQVETPRAPPPPPPPPGVAPPAELPQAVGTAAAFMVPSAPSSDVKAADFPIVTTTSPMPSGPFSPAAMAALSSTLPSRAPAASPPAAAPAPVMVPHLTASDKAVVLPPVAPVAQAVPLPAPPCAAAGTLATEMAVPSTAPSGVSSACPARADASSAPASALPCTPPPVDGGGAISTSVDTRLAASSETDVAHPAPDSAGAAQDAPQGVEELAAIVPLLAELSSAAEGCKKGDEQLRADEAFARGLLASEEAARGRVAGRTSVAPPGPGLGSATSEGAVSGAVPTAADGDAVLSDEEMARRLQEKEYMADLPSRAGTSRTTRATVPAPTVADVTASTPPAPSLRPRSAPSPLLPDDDAEYARRLQEQLWEEDRAHARSVCRRAGRKAEARCHRAAAPTKGMRNRCCEMLLISELPRTVASYQRRPDTTGHQEAMISRQKSQRLLCWSREVVPPPRDGRGSGNSNGIPTGREPHLSLPTGRAHSVRAVGGGGMLRPNCVCVPLNHAIVRPLKPCLPIHLFPMHRLPPSTALSPSAVQRWPHRHSCQQGRRGQQRG